MFCNPHNASFFLPCTGSYAMYMCTLSGWNYGRLSFKLQYFTVFERYNELCLQLKHHQRNAESNRKFKRWGGHLTFSQGREMLVTPF